MQCWFWEKKLPHFHPHMHRFPTGKYDGLVIGKLEKKSSLQIFLFKMRLWFHVLNVEKFPETTFVFF